VSGRSTTQSWLNRIARAALLWLAFAVAVGTPARAAELVMFEQVGCPWCQRWDREIAPIYGKTDLGRRAALRRVDITAARPPDLRGIAAVRYTPTFVLVDDGVEIGRIVGYIGEYQFWGLMDELIGKLKPAS
jgi:thioredoxin-related protein